MSMDNMATSVEISLAAWGVANYRFWLWGGQFLSQFDIVIPNMPLYDGVMV